MELVPELILKDLVIWGEDVAWVNPGDLGGGGRGGEVFPLTLYSVPNCTSLSAVIFLLILILQIFSFIRIPKEVCSAGRSGA